jgi:hypothetical protein
MTDGVVQVFVLILRIGGWEAGVNILGNDTKLLVATSGHTRQVSLLERAIFVQCTTHKVGTVRKIDGGLLGLDTLHL